MKRNLKKELSDITGYDFEVSSILAGDRRSVKTKWMSWKGNMSKPTWLSDADFEQIRDHIVEAMDKTEFKFESTKILRDGPNGRIAVIVKV